MSKSDLNTVVSIHEIEVFGKIVTVVKMGSDTNCEIKDIRKGEITEHSKEAAKYHATKTGQGLVPVAPYEKAMYHLRVVT